MQSLLKYGFGIKATRSFFENLSPSIVKGMLKDKGFILINDMNYTRESFAEMASKYGNLIKFAQEIRPGMKSNQVLDLDGNSEKLVSGRAELPLHSDGNILKTNVDLVFLYADDIKNLKYQGGTTIVDFKKALDEMPPHLKKVLDEEKFETLGIEKGYYPEGVEPYWYQMETFDDLGWAKKFNIYLNYKDQSRGIGWITRLKGFSESENERFLNELDKYLRKYEHSYLHYWKKGDLLIMDNRRVLHSRQSYDDETTRLIFRIQLSELI